MALTKRDADSGQYQQVNTLEWNNGDAITVYLKDIAFPAKLLKKVFTNEDGSTGTLYLITNDLSIDADRMYEVYQKRWRIEGAPQAQRVMTRGFVMKFCKAVGKMVVGPPKSAVRSRLQTTPSGCHQE